MTGRDGTGVVRGRRAPERAYVEALGSAPLDGAGAMTPRVGGRS